MADVLGGLFAATNPTVADGDTLTVYEFLSRSEGRLRGSLAGQPDVLAEVLGVVGGAYRDMTQWDRADSTLRDALALRRRLHPRGPATAAALGELATLHFMRGSAGGDGAASLNAALVLAREQLALLRRLHGPRDLRLVSALGRIAAVHLQAHRLGSARAALDRGLALTRPHRRSRPDAHLQLVGLEGWYYAETGEHGESVRVAREILALHRRTGAPLADVALAERILGDQLYETGDFAGATQALGRALAGYRRVFGPDNRYAALVLGHLAATHAAAGRDREADRLFPVALAHKGRISARRAPRSATRCSPTVATPSRGGGPPRPTVSSPAPSRCGRSGGVRRAGSATRPAPSAPAPATASATVPPPTRSTRSGRAPAATRPAAPARRSRWPLPTCGASKAA